MCSSSRIFDETHDSAKIREDEQLLMETANQPTLWSQHHYIGWKSVRDLPVNFTNKLFQITGKSPDHLEPINVSVVSTT